MEPRNDDRLAERLKRKDTEALAQLIESYADSLYRLAERILAPDPRKEDVEECISDVFLTAWDKIGQFDPAKGTLQVWLFMLTKYKSLDYRRKLASWRDRAEAESGAKEPADRGQGTEERVLAKETWEEVMRIADSLEPLNRTLFVKRYLYYEPVDTIAGSTGLTPKAVERRLARIRSLFRQRMPDRMEEESL
ncbi:sigma-70 family RNA polymerase sigma factor [Paenibacillus sp. GCM10012303]|uniref:sigma-70 family RNA polymerase sigma factor n=1 Tax=Paenibacillus sp. GCM10012303 TaxID=3317340 RepID=UPI00360C385C